MEATGPRVKERECAVTNRGEAVCIKQESECNEEAEGLKQEPRPKCATHEPVCVKQEVSWEDGSGLYADHKVKEELVLGPEALQRLGIALTVCGAAGRALAAPHEVSEPTSAEQETHATHKLNTNRTIVQITTYMCDICGKLYMKKTKLIRHIERHLRGPYEQARDGEKALFCNICNRKFRQTGHLNRHKRTHSGAKTHSCQICKKVFTRPESLRRHAIIHSGRKPHTCDTCHAQFTQLGNLTRHMRIHTGEKPYPCDICSRPFTQSCDLKKHMRTHTGVRPYSCDFCSQRFTCSGDLKKHKRTKGHKSVDCVPKKFKSKG